MNKNEDKTISGGVRGVDTSFRNASNPGRGEIENRSYLSSYGDGVKENFTGRGPKGWRRSSERIREDVCEALYHSAMVDASDIDIIIEDKILYLRGTVDSRETKREAQRCVEDLPGIDDVQNELRISRKN
jgi:osmotically-inducible protein OsmY